MRLHRRIERIRLVFREDLWPLGILAAILGGGLAVLMIPPVGLIGVGYSFVEAPDSARSGIALLFGTQATVLSIGLSLTMIALQNASSNYSPRLLGVFVRMHLVRWVIPGFVFCGTFELVSVWGLGFGTPDVEVPQPALAVSFLLLFLLVGLVLYQITKTIGAIRVEQMLDSIVISAQRAAKRMAARKAALRLSADGDLDSPGSRSTRLLAESGGYVVDIEWERLVRLAGQFRARVWLDRGIGDWIHGGEEIGRIEADEGELEPGASKQISECVLTWRGRSFRFDAAFGIQLLSDIGKRSMSSTGNDPSTARMSLQRLRDVLECLDEDEIEGAWVIADPSGTPRVRAKMANPAEQLSIAVEGIARYGSMDPDVLAAVVDLLSFIGAHRPGMRDSILVGLRRIREDAARLDPGRAAHICDAVDLATRVVKGEAARREPRVAPLYWVEARED